MEDFGKYLKALREKQRLSLREVQELCGVSNAYLSQIESGKRKNAPQPKILEKLAEAYRVSFNELLIAAGYLKPKDAREKEKTEVNRAFDMVLTDPKFHWGTRLKGTQMSLEAKKVIIEMYQKLTKKRIL
jgi:transcriptional regulator with XRE-family HTH domain